MRHRGAFAADRRSGDGAGLLLPIPRTLVPSPWCGLAMLFVRSRDAGTAIEAACRAEGIDPVGRRDVPVRPAALGAAAGAPIPPVGEAVLRGQLGSPLH